MLVNLLELDRPNLQIKFRITIEGAGITLRTSPAFMPRPLNIQGGVPELFTGADFASYFNPDHMDFSGITRAAFKRSGQLPEGFYTFTLEVLEYNRNVRISNQSVSYAWIVLNDPPLLNTPFNGDKLIATDPQNIMFSWTPRHTASPNAAFSTEYEFRMVELYPGQTNPDIAIRSSNSIYTTTTTLTSLNYGIIEPTLIPGKRYAFRVRAYDTSGRDLFKNDGYSETYVFQYGDACGTFEGITAKTLDPQRARISWEPEQNHTGCVINYRKNGKEDWFTQEVNGSYGIVAQLAGRTTYEYQLIPQCGTILGEKSPVLTFTTPEVDESGFVCGAPIPEFDASDVPLMKPLLPLDVIQVGDWTVNLLNVTANGDGTYGGAGYAAVPNFNLANVRVVFDRILVNEDYQVVAGDIKTVYSEDSRFVLDIQKKEEEPEVVEVPAGEESDSDLTEDLVADVLAVEIPADIGEVVFSGGLLEVYDESGNLIEDADLDLPPEGEELTITDSHGDTWVVDGEGNVREGNVGETSTPESSEVDVIVQFKPTEESSYGFDTYNPDIPQLRHYYQNILTINDEEYVPAWKSVPVGMPDQVIAMAGENEFPENMRFRSSTVDLEPMAGQQDNEKHLSVIGKAHGDIDVIEAFQSIEDEEQVAGRINVVSYEKIYKTLEIVPVNGASIGDIHTIGDRINKIFQQAAVEWKVEAAEPFMVDPKLLENFDEGESGMLASFPDKMQRFNREFKRSRPVDKETYYIFIIDEGSASLSGLMPFKRQFGYVFTKNTSYTNKTIAHELAHGAFRLRHTFSSAYGIPQRSTDNLMDYNGDHDRLKKFQWDLIHDPENLVGWFEDDEESALASALPVLQAIREANIKKDKELDLSSYGNQVLRSNLKFGDEEVRVVIVLELVGNKNLVNPNKHIVIDANEAFGETGEFKRIQLLKATRATVKITTDEQHEKILINYLKLYQAFTITQTVINSIASKCTEQSSSLNVSYTCNMCVRDAFYKITGKTILYSGTENRKCLCCDPIEEDIQGGLVSGNGQANSIYETFMDKDSELSKQFEEIYDMEDEDYPDFVQMQSDANIGQIIVGVKSVSGGIGHIVILMPEDLWEEDSENDISTLVEYSDETKRSRPIALECGQATNKRVQPVRWSLNSLKEVKWYRYKGL
ncbi:MAG: fibronectin type III domain-containing protein [Cyclobacteriaceae bacterium]